MHRYFAEICFNGAGYHGWQVQINAHTVQQEVHNAFKIFFKKDIETTGAGRTDAGVHATRFFFHFDLDEKLSAEGLQDVTLRMNGILPLDINLFRIFAVKPKANARFDCFARTYEYRIYYGKNPFLKPYAAYVSQRLDVNLMHQACDRLLRHTDFASFSKSHADSKTTLCTLHEAGWRTEHSIFGEQLIFTIRANRFLRNMVRAIVGTLIDVGTGKITPDDFDRIIASGNRSEAGVSVAACGLFLTKLEYKFDEITA